MTGRVATAEAEIHAPRSKVWRALTDPDQIQKYMFGSRVETDWKPGSRITWKGEYEGKKYEDKGEILEVVEERRLKVTHFSPLSGKEDAPENYHTLLYELKENDGKTHVSLSQDNNPSEEAAEHSRENWEKMLSALKEVVEGQPERAGCSRRARPSDPTSIPVSGGRGHPYARRARRTWVSRFAPYSLYG